MSSAATARANPGPQAIGVGAVVLAVLVGGVTALKPAAGVSLALAPLLALLLIRFSVMRFISITVGGLLVLGSSSTVGPVKVVYAVILVLCSAVSAHRLLINPPRWAAPFRPLLWWGAAMLICMALGALSVPGESLTTSLRQGVFYLLVPIAPIVGLDAGRDVSEGWVLGCTGVLGIIAAIGFATDWLDRRGVSALSLGHFVVASAVLPALAFAVAVVCLEYKRGLSRLGWALAVLTIPIAMLITGTRTNLLILLGVLGLVGRQQSLRVPVWRMLLVAGLVLIGVTVILPHLAHFAVDRPDFLMQRLHSLFNVLGGDASADASYIQRTQQYSYALSHIHEHPIFGYGPGFTSEMSLDTPLATVVKLGWVGSFALVGFLVASYSAIRAMRRQFGPSLTYTALTGYVLVLCVSLPLGTPIEDRGFGFALILAFMGVAASTQAASMAAEDTAVGGQFSVPHHHGHRPRSMSFGEVQDR